MSPLQGFVAGESSGNKMQYLQKLFSLTVISVATKHAKCRSLICGRGHMGKQFLSPQFYWTTTAAQLMSVQGHNTFILGNK